jgi:hypothetical protein
LLAHPHFLGRNADEMDKAGGDGAKYPEQECGEARQRIIAAGENPNVGPRIDIMFNRQQEDGRVSAPMAKLRTIGVLLPANAAQQFTIGGMESDKVTAAAMVRPEDELLRRQLRESALEIAGAKSRAIPTDGDNFLIAKLRDPFDRVLKSGRKTSPHLPVKAQPRSVRIARRREKMKIGFP